MYDSQVISTVSQPKYSLKNAEADTYCFKTKHSCNSKVLILNDTQICFIMMHPPQKSNISVICCHISLKNQPDEADEQSTSKHTTKGLSGLLLGLSQISPSLNKHKGVFGRQLHFASRERQA